MVFYNHSTLTLCRIKNTQRQECAQEPSDMFHGCGQMHWKSFGSSRATFSALHRFVLQAIDIFGDHRQQSCCRLNLPRPIQRLIQAGLTELCVIIFLVGSFADVLLLSRTVCLGGIRMLLCAEMCIGGILLAAVAKVTLVFTDL